MNANFLKSYFVCFVVAACLSAGISLLLLNRNEPEYFQQLPSVSDLIGNQAWTKTSQNTLYSNTTRKILLLSYMRGGSRLGGSVFDVDPNVIMWHEPLAAYYMAKYGVVHANLPQHVMYDKYLDKIIYSPEEREDFISYITGLLTCRFNDIPPQGWMHKFLGHTHSNVLVRLRNCLEPKAVAMIEQCHNLVRVCGDVLESRSKQCPSVIALTRELVRNLKSQSLKQPKEKITEKLCEQLQDYIQSDLIKMDPDELRQIIEHELCVERLRRLNLHCMVETTRQCQTTDIIVVKVNRMRMDDVESLIRKNPDLYLIHYVRDPRAIAVSRTERHLSVNRTEPDVLQEAELICRRMREDLQQRHILERNYPNRILLLKYENLVLEPMEAVKHVYDFIGKSLHNVSVWEDYFHRILHPEETPKTERIAGAQHIDKWRRSLSAEIIKSVTQKCRDVLEELGYE